MCMSILSACMHLHRVYADCLHMTEDIVAAGTVVTDGRYTL